MITVLRVGQWLSTISRHKNLSDGSEAIWAMNNWANMHGRSRHSVYSWVLFIVSEVRELAVGKKDVRLQLGLYSEEELQIIFIPDRFKIQLREK